jgi:ribosomal protein RSM22 (predicted rRNA methylase)
VNATLPPSEALRDALSGLTRDLRPRDAARAVERLIGTYRDFRGAWGAGAPILRDRGDAAAYAAYRMPATFEAVRAALGALADAAPGWAPGSHLDVGGGTGAAVWAAEAVWPGGARVTTVVDHAEPALAVGRELAESAGLPGVEWRRAEAGTPDALPDADLLTVCYVLNELRGDERTALVERAARTARAVVVVEPGTPDGYERIMEARDALIGAGLRVAAPCPHDGACPIVRGTDWCHFSARVSRSSLHRQVKGGSLPYEDEKFGYVAAVRFPADAAAARVVRRPQIRKGQVLIDLCTADDGLRRDTVTKRHGPLYRAARDASWGDAWPPAEDPAPAEDPLVPGDRPPGTSA